MNKSFDEISSGLLKIKEVRDARIARENKDKNQLLTWFKAQDKK